MPEPDRGEDEDIMAGDRRISRADASLPDWEVPDTAYRPIPIVWFAGAMILQMLLLFGLFVLLSGQTGALTVGLGAFVSGVIAAWTWKRGMATASRGWQLATIIGLVLQFALVALAAAPRF